jgi:hypothetical protein
MRKEGWLLLLQRNDFFFFFQINDLDPNQKESNNRGDLSSSVGKRIRDLWNPGNDDIRQRQDRNVAVIDERDGSETNTEHRSSPTDRWPNN